MSLLGGSPIFRGINAFPSQLTPFLSKDQAVAVRGLVEALFTTLNVVADGTMMTAYRPLGLRGDPKLTPKHYTALVRRILTEFLQAPGFANVRQLLGNDFYFMLAHCFARQRDLTNPTDRNGWHFDAAFMGLNGEMINVWVPLVDVGNDVPGLTFLSELQDRQKMWSAFERWAEANWNPEHGPASTEMFSDQRTVQRHLGHVPNVITPTVQAGDALVFNQATFHRTQDLANPSGVRTSIEFRLARSDAVPRSYAERQLPAARCKLSGEGASLTFLESIRGPDDSS